MRRLNELAVIAGAAAAVFIAAVAGVASPSARAATIFGDGTFHDADWSATKVIDTTAGAVAAFSAMQTLSGGNPDAYRAATMTLPTAGTIGVAHLRAGATYSPPISGAIQRLDLSYDFIVPGAVDFGGSDHILPLLVQGGSYYVPTFFALDLPGWHHIYLVNRQPNHFMRVLGTGPLEPDYSAAAAPIQFGYVTRGSASQPSTGSALMDNWSVAVNVPEPAGSVSAVSVVVAAASVCRARTNGRGHGRGMRHVR